MMFCYGYFLSPFFGAMPEKHEKDDEAQRLKTLNEEKRKAAIEKLGTRWLLHPANKVKRITNPIFKV